MTVDDEDDGYDAVESAIARMRAELFLIGLMLLMVLVPVGLLIGFSS